LKASLDSPLFFARLLRDDAVFERKPPNAKSGRPSRHGSVEAVIT